MKAQIEKILSRLLQEDKFDRVIFNQSTQAILKLFEEVIGGRKRKSEYNQDYLIGYNQAKQEIRDKLA